MQARMVTPALLLAFVSLPVGCAQTAKTTKPNPWEEGVTEAEFKAMHELATGAVPELRGQSIDLAGGKAYLSLPPGATAPLPGIVVIQEWWGLNDHIKHWADRLAAEGYAALAVDLYGGKVATTPDQALAAMQAVDPARALEILLAGHAFLKSDARVRATKRGSIGWCFGGAQSLRLAMAARDLDACVLYYGHPALDPTELAPIRASMLGVFGNLDTSISPATVDEFEKALTTSGVQHKILRYEGVHAFANPSNPRYDEELAGQAWAEVTRFFAAQLK